jgi:hypothetical protein
LIAAILATRGAASNLAAAINGHGSVTGTLSTPGQIQASVAGHASVSGLLIQAHHVNVTWTAASDQVDGYNVYRGSTSGGESGVPLNSSIITGTSFIDYSPNLGPNFYIVRSSIAGVLSQISPEVEVFIGQQASFGGHATVGGTLIGKTALVSAITGHASITATGPGIGKLIASINGRASVSGTLFGKAALIGSVAGQASVSGTIQAVHTTSSAITGHATVSGTAGSFGFLQSSITGHATVFATPPGFGHLLASVNGQATVSGHIAGGSHMVGNIKGQATVTGTLTGQAIIVPIFANINGQAVVSCSLNGLQLTPPLFTFGVSSQNPAILNFTQTSESNFYKPDISPSGSFWPLSALPVNQGQLGWEAARNQLLVLPSYAWLGSHPAKINAAGYVLAPRQSRGEFNIVLLQNYFQQTGSGPAGIVVYSDTLATFPLNNIIDPGTTWRWSLQAGLTIGNGGIGCGYSITLNGTTFYGSGFSNRYQQFNKIVQPVQLSIAGFFSGTTFGSDFCQLGLTQFEVR